MDSVILSKTSYPATHCMLKVSLIVHVLPSLSREAFAILYLLTMFVATVLLARKSFMGAYTICHEALSQLGEELPESLNCQQISDMVEATSKMLTNISDADLLEMKEMDKRQSI